MIEPGSPTFQADALTSKPPGKPYIYIYIWLIYIDKLSLEGSATKQAISFHPRRGNGWSVQG